VTALPPMSRNPRPAQPVRPGLAEPESRDDAGFTLLEVVIAMVIFTVFCAASLGLLVRTSDVTKGNLQRSAAANLAAEQIQVARSQPALSIDALTRTQKVANTTYTITQTVKYLSSDSATSVCDGASAQLAYKLVTVKVTWPTMGSIQPVRTDTLKAVGVGSDGLGTTGALAIGVNGADGTATSGQTVGLSDGSSATTGDDGCAVFVGLTAGTYTATLNTAGYVGLTNEQTTTKTSIGVSAGTVTRTGLSYDTARGLLMAIDSPVSGGIVPSNLPLRLSTSALAPTSFAACPATGTPVAACASAPTSTANGVAKELYPAVYTVKLGTCTESTPSQTSTDLRPSTADGSTATVPLGAVTVKVALAATPAVGIVGRSITLIHASQASGCTSGETYSMTSTANGSTLLVPYGTWTVKIPVLDVTGLIVVSYVYGTVTVSPTGRTASVFQLVQL
jgi:prepilin-type N-terminal cleavage/methylation domain-containing protein